MSGRTVAACLATTVTVLGVLAVGLQISITRTPSDPIEPVDAIVVLAGQENRLDQGVDLWERDVADLLIVSRGTSPWPEADQLCASEPQRREIFCFVPDPDSTRGEALEVDALANARGIESIALVTSESHMRRASRWMSRCTDVSVLHQPVSDGPNASSLREWLATVESLTLERTCG